MPGPFTVVSPSPPEVVRGPDYRPVAVERLRDEDFNGAVIWRGLLITLEFGTGLSSYELGYHSANSERV